MELHQADDTPLLRELATELESRIATAAAELETERAHLTSDEIAVRESVLADARRHLAEGRAVIDALEVR
jgi:hypothetical protein